jgi:hypothetical protein
VNAGVMTKVSPFAVKTAPTMAPTFANLQPMFNILPKTTSAQLGMFPTTPTQNMPTNPLFTPQTVTPI